MPVRRHQQSGAEKKKRKDEKEKVCVCVCVHVYVVYEDTNLYNNMGMT